MAGTLNPGGDSGTANGSLLVVLLVRRRLPVQLLLISSSVGLCHSQAPGCQCVGGAGVGPSPASVSDSELHQETKSKPAR